jgi:hypothetical protein
MLKLRIVKVKGLQKMVFDSPGRVREGDDRLVR